eukprot:6115854-Pyramimonas_sp.AAC.1
MAAFIKALADPWIIMAVWNQIPSALLDSGWVAQFNGLLIQPPIRATCGKGAGRMYDYGIISNSLHARIALRPILGMVA